jgi:hypothetical protein
MPNKWFRFLSLFLLLAMLVVNIATIEPVSASGAPNQFGKITPANNASFSIANMGNVLGARFWWLYAGPFPHEYCISKSSNSCDNDNWIDAKGKMYVYYKDLKYLGNPLTTGVYYWQVRALIHGEYVYANGGTGQGTWWKFTIKPDSDTAPSEFVKVSPPDGGAAFTRDVFKNTYGSRLWWKSAGAIAHEVCWEAVACDIANPDHWVDTKGKLYHYIDPLSLNENTTYYWHVRAISSPGQYIYANNGTASWTFKIGTDPTPEGFGKSSPGKNVSFTRSKFENDYGSRLWWKSAGDVLHEYCYSEDENDCKSTNPNSPKWTNSNGRLYLYINPLDLDIGTTYYWQVRAWVNDKYIYADSGPWEFEVVADTAPDFKKTSPASGLEFSYRDIDQKLNSGRFWWGSAGDVPHEYCFSTTNGVCTGGWVDASQKNYVHYDDLQLNPGNAGTVFYWQVRAFVNGQYMEADGGTWWSFKLMP